MMFSLFLFLVFGYFFILLIFRRVCLFFPRYFRVLFLLFPISPKYSSFKKSVIPPFLRRRDARIFFFLLPPVGISKKSNRIYCTANPILTMVCANCIGILMEQMTRCDRRNFNGIGLLYFKPLVL